MRPETGIRQRDLVGKRIAFADSDVETKYTLPFIGATWGVPFVVFDRLGGPPGIAAVGFEFDGRRMHTSASVSALRPIESMPVDSFASLVHFDPWWALRGVGGVDQNWLSAIYPTNIARPFRHAGTAFKIHDLRFAHGMDRLEAIIAKDERFHKTEFHIGELNLLALRPTPKAVTSSPVAGPSAKAL
jgi:hypothetical protein